MKIYTKFLSILVFSLAFCFSFGQYHVQNISTGNGSGSNWDNAISYAALVDLINTTPNNNRYNIEIKFYRNTTISLKKIDFSNYENIIISGGYSYEIDPETGGWIEVVSEDPTLSVVDAKNATKFFKFEHNLSIELRNFTLQNADFNSTTEKGSAISITNSPNLNLQLRNVIIKNNNITNTDAIYIENIKTVNFDFAYFDSNQTTINSINNGSALHISNVDKVVIKDSTFKNNKSFQNGAALYLKNINNVSIEQIAGNNTGSQKVINFENNSSSSNGGGIYNEDSNLNLTAIYFDNNSSINGGAIYTTPNSKNYLNRIHFTNNHSQIGGAIYNTSNSDFKILSSLFYNNSASSNGGGIYNKKEISVVNATFVKNSNSAISYSDNSKNTVYNSIFYLNSAKSGNFQRDISPESTGLNATNNIKNNIVEDYSTTNNLNGDPKFVDNNTDFNLQITSPAFNTGSEALFQSIAGGATSLFHDIDKRNRNYGLSVDMGAYELTYDTEVLFPVCPNIITPNHMEENVELQPTLSWDKINNANQYKLTIQENNTSTPIVLTNIPDNSVNNGNNIITYNVTNNLKPNTWYYIFIHPENTFIGISRESCPIFQFKTKTIPTAPTCPEIILPINNETNVSLTPEIKWNKVAEATSYTITIGTSLNGHDVLNNYNVGNVDTFRLQTSLKHSTQYFITINAVNEVGSSQNCATTTFFTLTPPDPCEQVKLSLQISKRDVTVNVINGEKPYEYRLDNGMWQTSNIFNDLAIGQHIIEIKTAEGCIKSTTLELPSFYNLITPNSDGKNDQVDFSFLTTKQNATLLIVDRFGKIVFKDQGENQFIWRGKQLNGMTLPTNTYWYFMEWKELNSEITNKLQGSILLKNK